MTERLRQGGNTKSYSEGAGTGLAIVVVAVRGGEDVVAVMAVVVTLCGAGIDSRWTVRIASEGYSSCKLQFEANPSV